MSGKQADVKKVLEKTLKKCVGAQKEAMTLLAERENPLDYYQKDKSVWRRVFYFCLMVYRGFTNNRCFVRTSALSYATLLALVPMLALVISISASLLKTQSGEQQIVAYTGKAISFVVPQLNLLGTHTATNNAVANNSVARSEEATDNSGKHVISEEQLDKDKVVGYVNSLVDNVRGGALGVTGFVSLIMIAILLLTKIEETFNDIWKVTKSRGWSARVLYYWGIITLGPLLMFVALSLVGTSKVQVLQEYCQRVPWIGDLFYRHLVVYLLPYIIISFCFSLLFYFMPSTKVNWSAAFVGGIFTGVLWQLNSVYSVVYISSVTSYSKMYGLLAAIPILLFGIYLSWMLVLLGCQVSYTWQNGMAYIQNRLLQETGYESKEVISIQIMLEMVRQFEKGAPPYTVAELASLLSIPESVIAQIMEYFCRAGIVLPCVSDAASAYVPALPPDRMTYKHILLAIARSNTKNDVSNIGLSGVAFEKYHKIRALAETEAERVVLRDVL